VFLGLFSCGGYEWQKQAILLGIVAFTAIALIFPPSRKRPSQSRIGLVIAVPVSYFLSQALASAF
jgi:hypothetical protein